MKTIEQRIEDMEAQLAQLKAEAKASADEWPKNGDIHWYVDASGCISWAGFNSESISDAAALATGNIYRTKEEAEREVERRKLLTQLRKMAKASWGGGNADWSWSGQYKWELFYVHRDKEWSAIDLGQSQTQGAIYFATGRDAEAAIETIGADRLMLLLED